MPIQFQVGGVAHRYVARCRTASSEQQMTPVWVCMQSTLSQYPSRIPFRNQFQSTIQPLISPVTLPHPYPLTTKHALQPVYPLLPTHPPTHPQPPKNTPKIPSPLHSPYGIPRMHAHLSSAGSMSDKKSEHSAANIKSAVSDLFCASVAAGLKSSLEGVGRPVDSTRARSPASFSTAALPSERNIFRPSAALSNTNVSRPEKVKSPIRPGGHTIRT